MRLFNVKMERSYATVENAEKAVAKSPFAHLRYLIAVDATGRYLPVFIGQDALTAGVHLGVTGFAIAG